jgi:hypothetical protein
LCTFSYDIHCVSRWDFPAVPVAVSVVSGRDFPVVAFLAWVI